MVLILKIWNPNDITWNIRGAFNYTPEKTKLIKLSNVISTWKKSGAKNRNTFFLCYLFIFIFVVKIFELKSLKFKK